MIKETFGSMKPIIAMVHFPPLPGAPLYDARRGMDWIIESASKDIAALQKGGVDAVMFGNEGDRPYLLKATPESLAAMATAIGVLKRDLKVPFGVNYLWDPVATVALGVSTGARFGREIFTGVYAADMGVWAPDCAAALRLRHDLGRDDMKLLFNINAEFAASLDTRPIEKRATSAVFSSLADIVCVSGPMTGEAVDDADLKRVKAALKDTPVFANTGVNIGNVRDILAVADGCVIGTHFKRDGNTWNPVDGDRVKRFMDVVAKLR
jgi:membrane complex biogenesis BtpA family protein